MPTRPSTSSAHGPAPATTSLDEEGTRRRIAGYYGNVTFMDREVGTVLAALDSLGLRDDTLVVYASDHGEMLGERGLFAKSNFYEASWRVPLIVRHPALDGGEDAARRWSASPTCYHGRGGRLGPAAEVHGQSLLPLLTGERERVRDYVYGELHAPRDDRAYYGISDGEWKLAVYSGDREQLYHLAADLQETRNLIHAAPERAAALRDALHTWQISTASTTDGREEREGIRMAESTWHYGQVNYSFEYERRLRVGFVGCGTHSWRNVYPTFQYAPVELVAVADPVEERARLRQAVRRAGDYADHRQMLDASGWTPSSSSPTTTSAATPATRNRGRRAPAGAQRLDREAAAPTWQRSS